MEWLFIGALIVVLIYFACTPHRCRWDMDEQQKLMSMFYSRENPKSEIVEMTLGDTTYYLWTDPDGNIKWEERGK